VLLGVVDYTSESGHTNFAKHGRNPANQFGGKSEFASRINQADVAELVRRNICLRLMEGANIYQIAESCRTSEEMTERFYASHTSRTS
jgi:hypothetical protein